MVEPTKAQMQEFWGKFRFKHPTPRQAPMARDVNEWWLYPDGDILVELPPIDLNNLFLYAVPLVLKVLGKRGFIPPITKLFQLWYDKLVTIAGDSSDVQYAALALYGVCDDCTDSNWADQRAGAANATDK